MKIINSGYLGWTIKLSKNAKNASFGRLAVKRVSNKLHVNLVNVMFLVLMNLIISGSDYSKISYIHCKNLLFGKGKSSNKKLIQCVSTLYTI